jgi:hypothetical protein
MTLETVRSSAIHAIGYDVERRTLEIIFTGGGIYHFHNVPPEIYRRFLATNSKGSFFQDWIRGRYPHERLGRFRQRRPPLMRTFPAA